GFSADVYEFTLCQFIGNRAIANYKESPAPIVLIGHSMGGLCSIVISEMAAEEKVPISLVIAIDPAHATGDVPLGASRDEALAAIRLVGLTNDVSLRNLIPGELAKGFGFFQSKPASAFSPVFVTPDALGDWWRDGKLHRKLMVDVNGQPFGR
ncbi:alpha/beta fold hydrolase, partial [Streptococcus suis]